jgi:hypothetical protein
VPSKLKYGTLPVTLICLSYLLTAQNASAVSVEIAKKCGALTDMAYPFRVPGNPAAGRTRGRPTLSAKNACSSGWRLRCSDISSRSVGGIGSKMILMATCRMLRQHFTARKAG